MGKSEKAEMLYLTLCYSLLLKGALTVICIQHRPLRLIIAENRCIYYLDMGIYICSRSVLPSLECIGQSGCGCGCGDEVDADASGANVQQWSEKSALKRGQATSSQVP